MLQYAWDRYHRPIIIGETSGYQDHRAERLRMTMQESLKALNRGVDLHGICLYPCVDIPDWQSGEWAKIGISDIHDTQACERCPCDAYIEELRHWQRTLDRPHEVEVEELNTDEGRTQLAAVREYARRWEERTPGKQAGSEHPRQAA